MIIKYVEERVSTGGGRSPGGTAKAPRYSISGKSGMPVRESVTSARKKEKKAE